MEKAVASQLISLCASLRETASKQGKGTGERLSLFPCFSFECHYYRGYNYDVLAISIRLLRVATLTSDSYRISFPKYLIMLQLEQLLSQLHRALVDCDTYGSVSARTHTTTAQ